MKLIIVFIYFATQTNSNVLLTIAPAMIKGASFCPIAEAITSVFIVTYHT